MFPSKFLASWVCRSHGCNRVCDSDKTIKEAGELPFDFKEQVPWTSKAPGSDLSNHPDPKERLEAWFREVQDHLEERPRECVEVEKKDAFYTGQWLGSVRHGHGCLEHVGVGSYTGQFVKNSATGAGQFIKVNSTVYDGQWLNGRAHGWGTLVHADGSTYKGEWEADLRNGSGMETWVDGSLYEGDYLHGKKHGHGTFRACDESLYEGEFVDELMHGDGQYDFPDGRVYKGQWQLCRMAGRGRMDWPDGKVYDGDFKDDKRWGFGRYMWPDGSSYEGQWEQGKQHKLGKFIDKKGVIWSEHWKLGVRIQRERFIQANGKPGKSPRGKKGQSLAREPCEALEMRWGGSKRAPSASPSRARQSHTQQIVSIDGSPMNDDGSDDGKYQQETLMEAVASEAGDSPESSSRIWGSCDPVSRSGSNNTFGPASSHTATPLSLLHSFPREESTHDHGTPSHLAEHEGELVDDGHLQHATV